MKNVLKVGLTGGIGCGKSAATRLFQQYDVPVIDADLIAKELVQPGQPCLQEIAGVFGRSVMQSDGYLNRPLLKQKIFANDYLLNQLELILHPAIRQAITQQMSGYLAEQPPYIIVDVPLLIEKNYTDLFDEVVVVDCTVKQQLKRVVQRDGLGEEVIQSIIAKQVSRIERLKIATQTLDNSGSLEALAVQVETLHRKFSQ